MRIKKSTSALKQKDYTFIEKHEVNCLQGYLQKMNDQVFKLKKENLASKFQKVRTEMPNFQHYLDRSKNISRKELFKKEAMSAMRKVQSFSSALCSNLST